MQVKLQRQAFSVVPQELVKAGVCAETRPRATLSQVLPRSDGIGFGAVSYR